MPAPTAVTSVITAILGELPPGLLGLVTLHAGGSDRDALTTAVRAHVLRELRGARPSSLPAPTSFTAPGAIAAWRAAVERAAAAPAAPLPVDAAVTRELAATYISNSLRVRDYLRGIAHEPVSSGLPGSDAGQP